MELTDDDMTYMGRQKVKDPMGYLINRYTTDEYIGINDHLRGIEKNDGYNDIIDTMDGLIQVHGHRFDQPVKVYRKITDARWLEGKNLKGKILSDPGFLSVTHSEKSMREFDNIDRFDIDQDAPRPKAEMEIELKPRTSMLIPDRFQYSSSGLNEIILPRGLKFKVTEHERSGDLHRIKMEMVHE